MLTLTACKELLDRLDFVTEIHERDEGWIGCGLKNLIREDEPFMLVCHPIVDKAILRLRICSRVRVDDELAGIVHRANRLLEFGAAWIDEDGQVCVEINHACRDAVADDPGDDVFVRLLRNAYVNTHEIVGGVMIGKIAAVGLPTVMAMPLVESIKKAVADAHGQRTEEVVAV